MTYVVDQHKSSNCVGFIPVKFGSGPSFLVLFWVETESISFSVVFVMHVISRCTDIEVFGINAPWGITFMQYQSSFWNRAEIHRPYNSVSPQIFAVDTDNAVPVLFLYRANPSPVIVTVIDFVYLG